MINEDARLAVFDDSVASGSGKAVSATGLDLGAALNDGAEAVPSGVVRTHSIHVHGDTAALFVCAACGLAVEGDAFCAEGDYPIHHPRKLTCEQCNDNRLF